MNYENKIVETYDEAINDPFDIIRGGSCIFVPITVDDFYVFEGTHRSYVISHCLGARKIPVEKLRRCSELLSILTISCKHAFSGGDEHAWYDFFVRPCRICICKIKLEGKRSVVFDPDCNDDVAGYSNYGTTVYLI